MKPLNFKIVDDAIVFLRAYKKKNDGEVPEWSKYQKLCEDHLKDAYIPKPKMPPEYYYAYLREKGLSDDEARVRMGMEGTSSSATQQKKSFWKFW
jgi:hypothetical protein